VPRLERTLRALGTRDIFIVVVVVVVVVTSSCAVTFCDDCGVLLVLS
jgi:hypothetical protein